MKFLINILLIILMLQVVSATTTQLNISAGTTTTIKHFDYCTDLNINITGQLPIDANEYTLIGCDEITTNYWHCNCSNNYDLKINTTIYTQNTYNFGVVYDYEKYESTGGSSGSKTYYTETIEINNTIAQPQKIEINNTITQPQKIETNNTIEEPQEIIPPKNTPKNITIEEPPEEKSNNTTKIIVAILLITILISVLWYGITHLLGY